MHAHEFLVSLTVVLGVAAVTTVVFQYLRQPVVLGYILAGFIVGPNVPIPLMADRSIVQTLSELGVILLMFSLGLEFSLGKLIAVGPTAGLTALLQSSLMAWLGFMTGQFFGWTLMESLFCGAIVAISSTTIIAKAFDEQNVRGPLRELVVGILIVEDLIAILLMATLTALVTGAGLSAGTMGWATGKLVAFLIGLVVVGLLLVPRGVRAVSRLGRPEVTLVTSIGFCFAVSLLAQELGYSVALGAFIAGSLIAESGQQHEIQYLVGPVRDVFAAIFFVSVGVLIDPSLIAAHWEAIAVLTGVVLVGKIVGTTLGAFLTGNGVRTSVQAGMSLAQIGEFSFIIASLGLSLRATGEFLYPVAVAVSAITTLTTPLSIKISGPVASFVDRIMPGPLQTFFTLYASWIEQLRTPSPNGTTRGATIRRLLRLLVLDMVLVVVLALGAGLGQHRIAPFIQAHLGATPRLARVIVIAVALILALPLLAGVVRVARRLGLAIAEAALPAAGEGKLDLAAAPRRALIVTLEIGMFLLTALPILAITQPIIGGYYGPFFFVLMLLVFGVAFWRGATNLQGHVQAGAQAIVGALISQARPSESEGSQGLVTTLEHMHELLPGMGKPVSVHLAPGSPVIGKSLSQIDLRGITGATVLAIARGEEGLIVPTASEVLQVGDVLALAGGQDAILAARALLDQEEGT